MVSWGKFLKPIAGSAKLALKDQAGLIETDRGEVQQLLGGRLGREAQQDAIPALEAALSRVGVQIGR